MNKRMTEADVEVARDLHGRGLTWRAIGERFGVTAEAARRRCAKAPAKPPETAPAPAEDIIAEAEAALTDETTDEGMLDALIRDVRSLQRRATTEAQETTCIRLLGSLVAQRFKMRPQAPPDLNQRPDYQRAAAEVRAKLHDMLERAMTGK